MTRTLRTLIIAYAIGTGISVLFAALCAKAAWYSREALPTKVDLYLDNGKVASWNVTGASGVGIHRYESDWMAATADRPPRRPPDSKTPSPATQDPRDTLPAWAIEYLAPREGPSGKRVAVSVGWPWSLAWGGFDVGPFDIDLGYVPATDVTGAWMPSDQDKSDAPPNAEQSVVYPYRVLWFGLALDALVTAVALVLLGWGVMTAVRYRRARRGQCVWCGYQSGGIVVCPECGRLPSSRSGSPPTGTHGQQGI